MLTPLAGFPSVLALRDLRRCVRRALETTRLDRAAAGRLLELDPLTVVRCMRFAAAPLHGPARSIPTIPELVQRLGVSFVKRAFCNPALHPINSKPVRELWLYSLAKGVAARQLAAEGTTCEPDQAFVLGMLHDLPAWSAQLAEWRGQTAPPMAAEEWVARWNLPLVLGSSANSSVRRDLGLLLDEATTLAFAAGFRPPQRSDAPPPPVASMDDLVRGRRVRVALTEMLERFGLQPSIEPHGDGLAPRPAEEDILFANKTVGRMSELVLSLVACQQTSAARAVLTATTSAALRYLDFDRAYATRWIRGRHTCWIRYKADLTPAAMPSTQVALTAAEQEMFESAVGTGEPQLLVSGSMDGEGLMSVLGSDVALVVPVNSRFHVPSLLVLDRSVSGVAIDLRRDRNLAKALANISSLMQENLLLTRQRARAMKFALTDPLTRLSNRAVGVAALRQEIARSNRSGDPLTVLMLDLDKFKQLNDNYGHLVGDTALRTTADALRKTTRKMDIVARYGGEEFMVVLPNTSIQEAAVTASRIHTAIESAGIDLDLPLTVSIGLATFCQGEDTVESILSRADRALYVSKERGRNRFSVDAEGQLA